MSTDNRNAAVLADFVAYCEAHPSERFWQALRNWSGAAFVFVGKDSVMPKDERLHRDLHDTFYWEGRDR